MGVRPLMSPVRLSSAVLAWLLLTSGSGCRSPAVGSSGEPGRPPQPTRTASDRAPAPASKSAAPAALLELFTSEGCSSCPAADETLAELTAEAERDGRRVFTLELHVDYWNQLGWTDPFSNSLHSRRQQAYARRFAGAGIYTPQLVINGHAEMVGSDAPRARSAIARELALPATATISLSASRTPNAIQIRAGVLSPRGGKLMVAVADDQARSRVSAGENAHRELLHRHVVRAFRSIEVRAEAEERLEIPWRRESGAVFVAAYLSDPATLAVLGAEGVRLEPHGG